MKLNVHSHGVLHGLGWVAILTDGWILHTSYFWLSAAGVWLLITSFLNMHKEVKIQFINDKVNDAGGLLREWIHMVIK